MITMRQCKRRARRLRALGRVFFVPRERRQDLRGQMFYGRRHLAPRVFR